LLPQKASLRDRDRTLRWDRAPPPSSGGWSVIARSPALPPCAAIGPV